MYIYIYNIYIYISLYYITVLQVETLSNLMSQYVLYRLQIMWIQSLFRLYKSRDDSNNC